MVGLLVSFSSATVVDIKELNFMDKGLVAIAALMVDREKVNFTGKHHLSLVAMMATCTD